MGRPTIVFPCPSCGRNAAVPEGCFMHKSNIKEYNKSYYTNNSERLRENAKTYYEEHKERVIARTRAYRQRKKAEKTANNTVAVEQVAEILAQPEGQQ